MLLMIGLMRLVYKLSDRGRRVEFLRSTAMQNASLYSSANSLQRNDAERILGQMVPLLKFPAAAKVLDVGCGSGDVTAQILLPLLPPDVKRVIAVDKSEKMVNHAAQVHGTCSRLSFLELDIEQTCEYDSICQKLMHRINLENNMARTQRRRGRPGIDSVEILVNGLRIEDQTDEVEKWKRSCPHSQDIDNNNANFPCRITESSWEDDRFDFIFSIYCLHWIKNQRQALRNMYSLMKRGGEAILVILADSTIFNMYQQVAQKQRWSPYMQDLEKFISPYHASENPARKLTDVATSVGFGVVSAECQQRTFTYSSMQALRDAIKAVNPFYTRMTSQDGEDFLTDCMDIVQQHNLMETIDQHIKVHYSIVVARLKK